MAAPDSSNNQASQNLASESIEQGPQVIAVETTNQGKTRILIEQDGHMIVLDGIDQSSSGSATSTDFQMQPVGSAR